MHINWKVRFKNEVWLASFLTFVVSVVFRFLELFEIAPNITQDSVMQIVAAVLQVLSLLGIIVDPTTKGIKDSNLAMSYTCPKCDKE